MWLIQKYSIHKTYAVVLFSGILVGIFLFSSKTYAETEARNQKVLYVKQDTGGVSIQEASLAKEERYFAYIQKGKMLLNEKAYKEALCSLNEGLTYAEENKIHPWNLRWRLADVYEAMGDRENFVKEIDWLIAHCQNEKTKKDFIQRKAVFLDQSNDRETLSRHG